MNPKDELLMRFRFLALLLCVGLLPCLRAQVPSLINYQSSIAIGGTNYHGVGYFKFALVSSNGFETYWSNDGTGTGGGQPHQPVSLLVNDGGYEVILGDDSLMNMQPVPPSVFANSAVHLRVWFSADNGVFQRVEPDVPFTATGYAMMAATVADGAVTAAKLADGAVTTGKLGPKAVTAANLAAGAAAQNLQASGGLVLSDQSNASNLVQAGFVKIGKMLVESDQWTAFDAFAVSPRTEALAAWTGNRLIIWGGKDQRKWWLGDGARYDPSTETWTPITLALGWSASAGAKGIMIGQELLVLSDLPNQHRRYDTVANTWRSVSSTNAPQKVYASSAILLWTGDEALVWDPVNGGKRYDPARNVWTSMAKAKLVVVGSGSDYAGAWTGTELIIWGSAAGVGERYNPATDTWRTISTTNAPVGRYRHTAVCTGPEVIFWGGQSSPVSTAALRPGGGIYTLSTDTWRSISTNNVLARSQHAAVWTGSQMLVWGGTDLTLGSTYPKVANYLDGGAIYTLKTDTWRPMATRGVPGTLPGAATAWNGRELYVWGGGGSCTGFIQKPLGNAGWRYTPATDLWRPMAGAPAGRTGHSSVWTGSELIIWGGSSNLPVMENLGMDSGARFNPLTGRWYPISSANAPTPRWGHGAVWTGREMIVWGGEGSLDNGYRLSTLNTGGRYDPVTDTWRSLDAASAPLARSGHSMVWTGNEALIFGGRTNIYDSTGRYTVNSGVRYYPQTDSWAGMTSAQAPSRRQSHAAVWTGTEMIVWGGVGPTTGDSYGGLATGARYNPVLNTWSPMSSIASGPGGIVAAVWTDQAMIVYGAATGIGGRYDPSSDQWRPIAAGGPRNSQSAVNTVWTGNEMLVWGAPGSVVGARYNPITDEWTPMTPLGAPKLSVTLPGVWTGSGLLLFSGTREANVMSSATYQYTLTKPVYVYQHP